MTAETIILIASGVLTAIAASAATWSNIRQGYLEKSVAALQCLVDEQQATIERLQKEIERRDARITQLENLLVERRVINEHVNEGIF